MKYVYITGASSGIGKAIAESLLKRENFKVIGISRSCTIEHPDYMHVTADLSDTDQTKSIAFEIFEDSEQVVLINNAGTLGEVKHIGDLDESAIINGLNVNVVAPMLLTNKFIKAHGKYNFKKLIINVTSGAAQHAYDGWGIYSPSKAALDMFTKVTALEQGDVNDRVKVLAIAPGVVATNMQDEIRNTDKADFNRKQKFIDLFQNKELYDPKLVGEAYADVIEHPEKVNELISRISLD